MKKAVYKIANKINGKIYIGESKRPEERFREHCIKEYKYESLIHRAIKKYGEENFTFEIIGWFEDWAEKEKYYISFYRSLAPYGYNLHPGGGEPPIYKGEDNPASIITQEIANGIIQDLLNYSIPRKTILHKYKVTTDIIRHINEGSSWRKEALTYPLRPQENQLDKMRADKVKELLRTTKLSQAEIGKQVGWNRSAVTMINIGKNHYDKNIDYPIRKSGIDKKPIKMYSIEDGKLIKIFDSHNEAARFLNKPSNVFNNNLARALKQNPSIAYGYRWEE